MSDSLYKVYEYLFAKRKKLKDADKLIDLNKNKDSNNKKNNL